MGLTSDSLLRGHFWQWLGDCDVRNETKHEHYLLFYTPALSRCCLKLITSEVSNYYETEDLDFHRCNLTSASQFITPAKSFLLQHPKELPILIFLCFHLPFIKIVTKLQPALFSPHHLPWHCLLRMWSEKSKLFSFIFETFFESSFNSSFCSAKSVGWF